MNSNVRFAEFEKEDSAEAHDGKISIWVAKVLALLRVPVRISGKSLNSMNASTEHMDMAFVQYFDFMEPQDGIDEALGCLRLRWSREEGEEGISAPAPWCDLLDVNTIKGTVHVVRGDYGIEKTTEGGHFLRMAKSLGTSSSFTLIVST